MRPTSILLAAAAAPALAHAAAAQEQVASTHAGDVVVAAREIAADLAAPWGLAFLPDARILVTQKAGDLVIVGEDGAVSEPLSGTPEVYAQGQGGLMDVAIDPQFAENRFVYLAFAEPGENGTAGTALGRGRLADDRIEDFEVIFRQQPKVEGPNHFGNRIVFSSDGHLFLTLGERFQFAPAQDRANTLGAIVRLNPDGSIPDDNPFVDDEAADDAIWSYGHRNIEAAAVHPDDGAFYVAEMGPLGGDELNRIERGANYGWPVVSWGVNYDGVDIPDPTDFPDYTDALHHWNPVRSPSGMIVYTGDLFPQWRGDLLFGALSAGGIERVDLEDGAVAGVQFLPFNTRIRDLAQSPDGAVYALTNGPDGGPGALWRIEPLEIRQPAADEARSGPGAAEDATGSTANGQ